MTPQEIREDFLQYLDPYGLISPNKQGVSTNDILYTAISLIILQDNNALDETTKNNFYQALISCQVSPGNFKRLPTCTDLEAPDDYVGLGATGCVNFDIPQQILHYGSSHFFIFNNQDEKKFTWNTFLGRQLQLIQHWYYGSKKSGCFLLRLWWSICIIYSALTTQKTNQDGWFLSWLLIRTRQASNTYSFTGFLAEKLWYYKLYQTFPTGLKELPYLNNNLEHPINRYWVK